MVERIRKLCEMRHTNFSRLEKELGFANGSLVKSKETTISAERVRAIANYFNVSMEYILCGTDESNDRSAIFHRNYLLADPEIQSAVDRLLKVPQSDS